MTSLGAAIEALLASPLTKIASVIIFGVVVFLHYLSGLAVNLQNFSKMALEKQKLRKETEHPGDAPATAPSQEPPGVTPNGPPSAAPRFSLWYSLLAMVLILAQVWAIHNNANKAGPLTTEVLGSLLLDTAYLIVVVLTFLLIYISSSLTALMVDNFLGIYRLICEVEIKTCRLVVEAEAETSKHIVQATQVILDATTDASRGQHNTTVEAASPVMGLVVAAQTRPPETDVPVNAAE